MQHPFDNLSREELLALAKQQQAELEQLRERPPLPVLDMAEAGSIAQAAMNLSGVFQASQRAADIYLQGVETMKARQETEYFLRLAEAEQQAQQMLLETQTHCQTAMTRAQESAAFYWSELQQKLDALFAQHPGLTQALQPQPEEDEGFGPDD